MGSVSLTMGQYVNVRIDRTIKTALDIYIALQGAQTGKRPTLSQAIEKLLVNTAPEVLQQAKDATAQQSSDQNEDA